MGAGQNPIYIVSYLAGWTSIYQLFWCSLVSRVLTHSHICTCRWICNPANSKNTWFWWNWLQVLLLCFCCILLVSNKWHWRKPDEKLNNMCASCIGVVHVQWRWWCYRVFHCDVPAMFAKNMESTPPELTSPARSISILKSSKGDFQCAPCVLQVPC